MNDLMVKASQRLAVIPPKETDLRLEQSLSKIIGDGFAIEKSAVFGKDGSFNGDCIVKLERPRGITVEQISQAQKALKLSTVPLSSECILEELKRLRAICKVRNEDAKDIAEDIPIILAELQKVPADILMESFQFDFEWMPKVSDIMKICKPKANVRQRVLSELMTWKPWDDTEELKNLEKSFYDYRFYSKHYAKSDPERAQKFKEAAERVNQKIEKMTPFEKEVDGSNGAKHTVRRKGGIWTCTCESFTYCKGQDKTCKHIGGIKNGKK